MAESLTLDELLLCADEAGIEILMHRCDAGHLHVDVRYPAGHPLPRALAAELKRRGRELLRFCAEELARFELHEAAEALFNRWMA